MNLTSDIFNKHHLQNVILLLIHDGRSITKKEYPTKNIFKEVHKSHNE